jgi:hypothetical protein
LSGRGKVGVQAAPDGSLFVKLAGLKPQEFVILE